MNTKMFLRKKRQISKLNVCKGSFNAIDSIVMMHSFADADQNTCILHVVADHTFFNGPGNGVEVTV